MATSSRQQLKDFSLELMPSHETGLAELIDRFQVDALQSTRETYKSEPYLDCKLRDEDGWLDAWPGYVSARLLTICPRTGMDEDQALAGLKALEDKLRQLAKQAQPCLEFSGSLESGKEANKTIWKISSTPSRPIREMRKRMRESCEGVGFHVLSNNEPEGVVHIVVRNRWKNSGIEPPAPKTSTPLNITFDKVGFTRRDIPVAGQKYIREACGQTLCMSFGTAHIHDCRSTWTKSSKNWGTQEVASSLGDTSAWPSLGSTAVRPQPLKSPTQIEVIMDNLQHPDLPTPVEPIADQRLAAALQTTSCGYGGQALYPLSEASSNHDQLQQLPDNQQDGASQMSRLSALSCTSCCSWIAATSAGPRCFLPQTFFKIYASGTITEPFVCASDLAVGAHVESAEGECLEVVSIKDNIALELVELIAGTELLQVSPTHRIVIGGPTAGSTVQAKDLELGCQVMCASGAKPLREVRRFQVPDGQPVLAIRFMPDQPVHAFMAPDPILTMGQRQPTRRGGAIRRWGSRTHSYSASLPDTEWSFRQHPDLPSADGDDTDARA